MLSLLTPSYLIIEWFIVLLNETLKKNQNRNNKKKRDIKSQNTKGIQIGKKLKKELTKDNYNNNNNNNNWIIA